MIIKMHKGMSVMGILLILTACFRPHYVPQYVDVPEHWRFQTNEESTLCNLKWWEQFHDPVLDTFILIALKNNQNLKIAIQRVLEYYNRYRVTAAALYPVINGNASFTRTKSSIAVPASEATANPTLNPNPNLIPTFPALNRITNDYQLFLSLAWELDFWGRLWSASEAAYADLLSQIEARRAVVVTLVTSVANAYIILRQLDAQLEVSRKTLQSRLESLKLAAYRFELGETSELEVKQAQSEVEDAAIRVIEFERDIPIQEDLLSILLGENPQSLERGNPLNDLQYPVSIPEGLPSDLLRRRPDIMQAEEQLVAANARVSEAIALYFPQIELTGIYGSESNQLHRLLTSPAEMWQYSLTVTQPLFNAGQTYFQVRQAKTVRNEALFNYRQVILNAFREVEDALIAYQKNQDLVVEHQKQVEVLADYLHLAKLRYEEGEIDYLNVLDAERSLFNAQLLLVQSQSDSFRSIVQLYGALAGGWVIEADAIALERCEEGG